MVAGSDDGNAEPRTPRTALLLPFFDRACKPSLSRRISTGDHESGVWTQGTGTGFFERLKRPGSESLHDSWWKEVERFLYSSSAIPSLRLCRLSTTDWIKGSSVSNGEQPIDIAAENPTAEAVKSCHPHITMFVVGIDVQPKFMLVVEMVQSKSAMACT
jgi:hypothetical protein